jgi:hypothetical protein
LVEKAPKAKIIAKIEEKKQNPKSAKDKKK